MAIALGSQLFHCECSLHAFLNLELLIIVLYFILLRLRKMATLKEQSLHHFMQRLWLAHGAQWPFSFFTGSSRIFKVLLYFTESRPMAF